MDTQAKTAPMSSFVAAYWRVEEVVDRPVAGSSFMLGVIKMAAEEWTHTHTHTKYTHTKYTTLVSAAHVAFSCGLAVLQTVFFSLAAKPDGLDVLSQTSPAKLVIADKP